MGVNFTLRERSAIYRLLADNTNDIILKTDRDGFVVHASPAIQRLGFLFPNMLIGPHILDLVHPSRAAAIRAEHEAVLKGREGGKWIEFAALTSDHEERWFAIRMHCLTDERDEVYGVLSVMRSLEERRRFEEKLFAAEMTDPLTGLTNRQAFVAMLQHMVQQRIGGCLALFDIDHFKAINMKYGQAMGDEVLVVFSDFLRTQMRSSDIISRIGGECLAVLLPRASAIEAEAICQRIIDTLSEIRRSARSENLTISASAGIAPIAVSLDDTIKQAELALFIAKAKGRGRVELDTGQRLLGRDAKPGR